MANLAAAIKDEIQRLARKEVKSQTGSTKQAVAQYRREIAGLKRQMRKQEQKISFLEAQEKKRLEEPPATEEAAEGVRFSARSVKAQRERLGLSAADYAKLVGVSSLTIYNWEQGKTRPRQEQLAALVAVRGIGKREAQQAGKKWRIGGMPRCGPRPVASRVPFLRLIGPDHPKPRIQPDRPSFCLSAKCKVDS
jgi:DNA-binding transcriptional regulator YiaG